MVRERMGPLMALAAPFLLIWPDERVLFFIQALNVAVAGLLFVAHPLQTQAVTYVVQRMTSLAACLYLLAVLLYVRGRSANTNGQRVACFAGALAAGGLALGSKEIAIALPFALVLVEWIFFRDAARGWLRLV